MKKSVFLIYFFLSLVFQGSSQNSTNLGSDFWIAFPPNSDLSGSLYIFISSDVATSGNVTSAFPGVNQSFTVTPGVVTQLTVPKAVSLSGGIEDKGIHITSADPIAVYGQNFRVASTDGYMALPTPSEGLEYRVLTYKVNLSPSCFSVVATQDGTILTVINHQTTDTTTVTLDQGQTYHVNVSNTGEDVTGSKITSNFPITVYGSVNIANIPTGCTFGDHIVEQMFPVSAWGKQFVTVPLAGRDNSGDIFRFLANEDGTDVTINDVPVATLNEGDYYEVNLPGYNSIETSKPVLVAQFAKGTTCSGNITGDPFEMLISPREQFITNYTICTLAGFTSNWVNLVAPSYAISSIYQDGTLIPPSAFTQIGTTNFYGAQRSITDGSHTFTCTFPFGVFVYGWTAVNSYGYPGGASLSPVGTVNSISITPPHADGILNVTNVCFTANVLDNFNNPVENILVTFNISGVNPVIGTAYTDVSGNAVYCYTQTGTIPGTDSVYAEAFGFISTKSTVDWSLDCGNPTNGGTIGNAQTGCESFVPDTIRSVMLPTGQSGTLEFKWQKSLVSGVAGFIDIAATNSADYAPGTMGQNTWFRRLAKVDCKSDWAGADSSNVIMITVTPNVIAGITITADPNPSCPGVPVLFTGNPVNGGANPSFQWKVNGVNAGSDTSAIFITPSSGDVITCTMNSSIICVSGNPVTSNPVTMTVNPDKPVSITITPSQTTVCTGTVVLFNSMIINGGSLPAYRWLVNGIFTGSTSSTYSYPPVNNDIVTCELTSNATCATGSPAISNGVTMMVNDLLTVSVSILPGANPVCPGIPVTFTATALNAGALPIFLWSVNGIPAGTNNPVYTYTPATGDVVGCTVTSSLTCTVQPTVSATPVIMSLNPAPVVTVISCFDTITTVNAQPIRLKGGIPLGGTYSGPGVNSLTGIFTPSIAGVGPHTITYTCSNVTLCTAAAFGTIVTRNALPFTCGNVLTDIRDNKVYTTIKIGTQCWMAANLNFGNTIASSQDQRDNCINEKYCYNDNPVNCTNYGGLYQWNEVMRFDDTPASQGFCPPGWHIPTENDWNILFATYVNSGFAGSPLKYSGYSGFNALLSGARHINKGWDFQGFATFFWSSTPRSADKAWAHGMNDANPSVSGYPASRVNAFSVRCLKD